MIRRFLISLLTAMAMLPTLLWAEPQMEQQRYFDGRQWRSVWLDRGEVAELIQDNGASVMRALAPTAQLKQQGRRLRIWQLDEAMSLPQLTRNLNSVEQHRFLPVFRLSAEGGARLVPVGNLVVRFKASMKLSQVKLWAEGQGVSLVQKMSPPDTYLIAAGDGMTALERANQIQQSGAVKFAVPEWLRPTYKR
jgi:hypothetical protein